ncbi:MAG: AAA family ATPase [Candidatus Sumerlaeota bacterium]|nr:AAA family ATPase [Candidatus Sumerlaeota bacterium]
MYISKIVLENIRGFSSLRFDLSREGGRYAGWTVFTGDNGSGKSALLKAIAIALMGKETARALQPSFGGWIRDGAEQGSIQLEIARSEADDALSDSGKAPAKPFPAKISIINGSKEPSLEVAPPKKKSKTYAMPERTIWSHDSSGWFSCGYGPFRRVLGASVDAMRQMSAPSAERYVTMFREDASLAEMAYWLRELKYKELEGHQEAKRQLEILLALLQDNFMPQWISVDRVDSEGLWLRDRNGFSLSWPEMSDGYRAAVSLLADILRHLIRTYGISGLLAETTEGQWIIARSGVVLIDEIDAHLHPEWQRQIGFWLKRHFPNIQFLVTSHSPIICQAADDNGLFVLPEPGSGHAPRQLTDEEYKKVIASRPDTILLSSAFGMQNTRSPYAVESRAEYAKLNAKKRSGAKLSPTENDKIKQLDWVGHEDEEA